MHCNAIPITTAKSSRMGNTASSDCHVCVTSLCPHLSAGHDLTTLGLVSELPQRCLNLRRRAPDLCGECGGLQGCRRGACGS